jgi:hypothetical protein
LSDGAAAEYEQRLSARLRERTGLETRARWISHARLVVFLLGLATLWLAYGPHTLAPWTPGPPVVLFVALAVWHDRVLRGIARLKLAIGYYERGLARIRGDHSAPGDPGEAERPGDHDYADDLDLFGPGSLFELISTARTSVGRQTLGHWLCGPAPPEELRLRHAAVLALAGRIDLREDLASLGEDVGERLDAEALAHWAARPGPAEAAGRGLRIALGALSSFTLGGLAAWIAGVGPVLFVLGITVQSVTALALRKRAHEATLGLDAATRSLGLMSTLLLRLEQERFETPKLTSLGEQLVQGPHAASLEIRRLRRLADLRDAMRNQFFIPIGALLLWGTQCSLAGEAWRARCGRHVAEWIEALAELEALASIAAYAYEHPDDPFPELDDGVDGPVFDARGLGHPLIAAERCVANDLRLAADEPIAIVSGSNMSGKSTLLRSVGVAVAMAQAGAPVRAQSLRLSPLSIGASLRIVDSLQAGTSHFYAELVRLRRISELARAEHGPPLLFLLDEVLHGTNSHDRRIGAEAIVRDLLDRGALGLVTTHDLALARIADEMAPRVRNVHFEDRIEAGRLEFDYRLRPGVVERSNALDLMREVGLDV